MRRAPDSLTRQSKVGYLDARECTSVPADSPTDLEVGHATGGLVSALSKIPSLFGQLIAYSSRRKAHAYGSRQPDRESGRFRDGRCEGRPFLHCSSPGRDDREESEAGRIGGLVYVVYPQHSI